MRGAAADLVPAAAEALGDIDVRPASAFRRAVAGRPVQRARQLSNNSRTVSLLPCP
jgi:hypothetical protein